MSIQTVEIHGERFVILPEKEFLALQNRSASAVPKEPVPARFEEVIPLRVSGEPASDMLIRDRR